MTPPRRRNNRRNPRPWDGMTNNFMPNNNLTVKQDFAKKYSLPFNKANKIVNVIYNIDSGNINAATQIGMNSHMLKSIASGKKISGIQVNQISHKLGINNNITKRIFNDFTTSINQEIRDPKSDYWNNCTQTGTWKTNHNKVYKALSWYGCGPNSLYEDQRTIGVKKPVVCQAI